MYLDESERMMLGYAGIKYMNPKIFLFYTFKKTYLFYFFQLQKSVSLINCDIKKNFLICMTIFL